LEVLQTIYNNQLQLLNNRLSFLATWLAILATAVMVPNTIATVFGITSIGEKMDPMWAYFWIGLSTVMATIAMYLVLRQKKWLPPKLD
jgi:magnesium transporter